MAINHRRDLILFGCAAYADEFLQAKGGRLALGKPITSEEGNGFGKRGGAW
jgi:hypothetical protein